MRNDDVTIISSSLSVMSPSIANSRKENSGDFIKNRFYVMSVSHNSALLTGSTLAYQHRDMAKEPVLDAGGLAFVKDKTGINTGIRQATADGLGGSPDDAMENASIARIASFACQSFIESKDCSGRIYDVIAQSSKEQGLSQSSLQLYDSQCAMAAAALTYTGKGQYHAQLSNMGDTLLVVLSPDLAVKKILPARHIYRGMGVWTPASVQMLEEKDAKKVFIHEEYEAQQGDVIISMTDGVWSELALSPFLEKDECREFKVDKERFEKTLKAASLPAHCSAHEMAVTLLHNAVENSLAKRYLLLELVSQLKKIPLPDNKTTVDEIVKILNRNGQEDTAKKLLDVLFSNSGDGTVYHRGVEIPFEVVLRDLETRTAGDCSTINVARVPYHVDECIRALLKSPDKASILLPALFAEIASAEQIKESITRLNQETVPANPVMLLGKLQTEKNIENNLLQDLERILQAVYQIKTIIKTTPLYGNRLNQTACLIDTLREPVKACVFELIKSDLVPPFSFLDIFGSREKTVFRQFSTTHGPGIKLEQFLKNSIQHSLAVTQKSSYNPMVMKQ